MCVKTSGVINPLARLQPDARPAALLGKNEVYVTGEQDEDLFFFVLVRRVGGVSGEQDRGVGGHLPTVARSSLEEVMRGPACLRIGLEW
jgi:hypothetical protein